MIFISENILLEYSKKIQQLLIDKFQKEHPRLPENEIALYISRFKEIQNSPKVTQKDIFQYSWNELQDIVHLHPKKEGRIKTGGPRFDPKDVIYQDDTFTILKADSRRKCIKYGNGYNFCISARGENNRYLEYRIGEGHTLYFIFNKNLSTDYDQEEKQFINPMHLLVLSVIKDKQGNVKYEVVDANDDGVNSFSDQSWKSAMTQIHPKLVNLKHLFVQTSPSSYEKDKYRLEIKLNQQLANLEIKYPKIHDHLRIYEITKNTYLFLINVLKNPQKYQIMKYVNDDEAYYEYIIQPKDDPMTPAAWSKDMDNSQNAHIEIKKPLEEKHIGYYKGVKDALKDYYRELMFLNQKKK